MGKHARAVIGANYGDEGKGLMVDWLCSQGAGVVIRFNGGAQAGHTVVTPDGTRHVFSHFGSGSLLGVPTYLSQFFVVNPLLFLKEREVLGKALGREGYDKFPHVYAHPTCMVTTFADMVINQRKENARGAARHGSVGLGFNETIERNQVPALQITMADLWNRSKSLPDKLAEICNKWAQFRCGKPIEDADKMIEAFRKACEMFADSVYPLGIDQCPDPVFEGAQGLLLSQDNKADFPHLTRSYTGVRNVRELCKLGGLQLADVYYVSRTYLTRHGAGPLPGEDPKMHFADNTNEEHAYQGKLRFAKLDIDRLVERCSKDFGSINYKLALTHCDQLAPTQDMCLEAEVFAHGPTRKDVGDK